MSLILRRNNSEENKSSESRRFTLRMESELFEEISQLAKYNKRSVAKEIECAVQFYINDFLENSIENENQ